MSKIPAQDKIYYCKQYVDGKMTQGQIAGLTNVDATRGTVLPVCWRNKS